MVRFLLKFRLWSFLLAVYFLQLWKIYSLFLLPGIILFYSSSSSHFALPLLNCDVCCCCFFSGEWEGVDTSVGGSHPGHTGPCAIQHTEEGGPQTGGLSRSSWRPSASDHGHGRLCGQLHSNRHQLPAYVDSGQEQPASLWSSTPTRPATIPSSASTPGTISTQWTVSGSSLIGFCSMSNHQTRTHLLCYPMPFCSHIWSR